MHPISEILAESDRREVEKLEAEDDTEDEEDLTVPTLEQLEEKKIVKRK